MSAALLVAAFAFALVHGTNTGATLLATGVALPSISPLVGLAIMVAGVAAAPFIVGTAVAGTVANDMVESDSPHGRVGMLAAVIVTILLVAFLSHLRIPTSLTLALVGAIAGFGFGARDEVHWDVVIKVLLMMAVAPVFGAVIAALVTRVIAPMILHANAGRSLRIVHVGAFCLLSFSYGANDSQKMLAVIAIAAGTSQGSVPAVGWQIAVASVLFAIGTVLGVARMSKTVSRGILPARPLDIVSTEASTAAAMLISTTVGAPIGLGQTLSGALIGSGMSQGTRRVRWREVSRIITAWIVTLPGSFLVAGGIGLAGSLV